MKIRNFLLVVVLVFTFVVPVQAANSRAVTSNVRLNFVGTTAECEASITANDQDIILATMKLWNGNNCIATWTRTTTTILLFDEVKSVTKGKSYELTVDFSINGVAQTSLSTTKTCT